MNPRHIPDKNDNVPPEYMTADNQFRLQSMGLLFKRLRRMNHSTQSELALRAHTDPSYLSDIEHGNANMSLEKVALLCKALGIGDEKLIHMSRQITYSAKLNAARSPINDNQNTCVNKTGQKDTPMINGLETEPVPESKNNPL